MTGRWRSCESENGIHVGGQAVEMDDDDGARASRDAALEFGGIEVVSVGRMSAKTGLAPRALTALPVATK